MLPLTKGEVPLKTLMKEEVLLKILMEGGVQRSRRQKMEIDNNRSNLQQIKNMQDAP